MLKILIFFSICCIASLNLTHDHSACTIEADHYSDPVYLPEGYTYFNFKWNAQKAGQYLSFTDDNLVVYKTKDTDMFNHVLGDSQIPKNGKYYFQIKILKIVRNDLMFGISKGSVDVNVDSLYA